MSGGGRLSHPGPRVADCPQPAVTVVPWNESPDENGDFSYDFFTDYPGPVRYFRPVAGNDYAPNTASLYTTFVAADGTEIKNGSINVAAGTSRKIYAVVEDQLGEGFVNIPQ